MLVQAQTPAAPRKRYTEEQTERALAKMDNALARWGWENRKDVIRLFLARQMIARRIGFPELNRLFTGPYASGRAQEAYESGEHFLLKPFIAFLCPLLFADNGGRRRQVIGLLRQHSPAFASIRQHSPAFSSDGPNASKSLSEMIELSKSLLDGLRRAWGTATIREILQYCRENDLVELSPRLVEELGREPRAEEYEEDLHESEKGDWLCDSFFAMPPNEVSKYCDFLAENTVYSTQHGVKGEEYPNVFVVFDDTEASWSQYSFTKLLTPQTSGEPTDGQRERGRKLAYVCFSRAEENLRILLFTENPSGARDELIGRNLFSPEQILLIS